MKTTDVMPELHVAANCSCGASRAQPLVATAGEAGPQYVEDCNGALGVTRDYVRHVEPATVRLRFDDDLSQFADSGTVAGLVRGSGTLVGPDLVLTAAATLRPDGDAAFPRDATTRQQIQPAQAATLMQCQFGYQRDTAGALREPVTAAVVELVEYRPGGLDVALLRLEPNHSGRFGWLELGRQQPRAGESVRVVAHPDGGPKMIDAGTVVCLDEAQIGYRTTGMPTGTTGAGVLDRLGRLIAVQTGGDTDTDAAVQRGVLLPAVLACSAKLRRIAAQGGALDLAGYQQAFVSWAGHDPGTDTVNLAGVDADGNVRKVTRAVPAQRPGHRLRPRIAAAGADAVLLWENDSELNAFSNLVLMRSRAGGRPCWGPMIAHVCAQPGRPAPSIAVDGRGNCILVWQGAADRYGRTSILARGFRPHGRVRIPVFRVDEPVCAHRANPVVTAARDSGEFLVAWEDDRDGLRSVYGRRFCADGTPLGADTRLTRPSGGQQLRPAVAMSANGGYLATAWEDDQDTPTCFTVRFRTVRWDRTGETISERGVKANGMHRQCFPAVAVTDQGATVVAWQDGPDRTGRSTVSVYGLRFCADGTPLGADTRLTRPSGGQQLRPAVAMSANGGYLATAWEDDQDTPTCFTVRFRTVRWDRTGETISERGVKANGMHRQCFPAVAVTDQGATVVAWQDGPDRTGRSTVSVYGLRPNGSDAFAPVPVHGPRSPRPVPRSGTSPHHDPCQHSPRVTILQGGIIVVGVQEEDDVAGCPATILNGLDGAGRRRWSVAL
ncbi:MAG: hypothetical protein CSA58_12405 [Micrococcales bacterium]|nr:MAG: hypothetical protein CSA58_12405 [Micrococcales bacterium]